MANSGTALSEEQIRLLHRFTSNITLLYDGDAAGIKASIRGIDMLLAEGMNIKVLLLPDGEDPDSFARKHNATEFQQYIADHEENFIRFKTNLLMDEAKNDPIKRATLIADMAHSIGLIPNEIIRYECLKECAAILNVNEQIILNEAKKVVQQRKEEYIEKRRKENEIRNLQPATAQPVPPPPIPDDGLIPPPPFQPEEVPEEAYEPNNFLPVTGWEKLPFYNKEVQVIKALIQHGEKIVCYMEEEKGGGEIPISVTEYISTDLKQDSLQFQNPVHRQILAEAEAHMHDRDFCAERYFLAHPNPTVSRLAADMLNEHYRLSKSNEQLLVKDEERLYELIPHLLIDFKLGILEEDMKQTIQQLNQPEAIQNPKRAMEIMTHYKDLTELLRDMAKRAGDRVILKS